MPFKDGENVGPYRVMEKLGQGGMATVYKAYHASLDRYVALKVLHPAFLEDPNFLARFQREARLVAKLEHTNIVPIYDFADHDGQPYLVMKFVEGETLKALLGRGRLSAEKIWMMVNSVGKGLAYAHKQGILHRDVKPSNVIVADDGQIYLADFGLARIAQSGESTLTSDMIMGTPQYISPEQAMGIKDLDNRTDIYSFAVMLYELVVGQVPFSSDTPFSVIHDHIYSPLPLPHLINPSVPDEVERVLLKALSKERNDRYTDVNALTRAFKKAWDDSKVDMDDVTITSPIRVPEKTTEAAQAVAAEALTIPPASTQEAPPPLTPPPTVPEIVATPSKKRRMLWPFIAGMVLVLFACAFAVKAINDGGFGTIADDERPALRETADSPSDTSQRPVDQPVSPEVEDARAWVQDSPDDPYAHLALGLALLDNNQVTPAYEELAMAADLAGDDIDFYFEAGFNLMDREAWAGAAAVFMRALQVVPPSNPDAPALADLFHENIYRAAVQPEMPNFLPFDQIGRIDEPMMRVAEARHTFYQGDPADAWRMLEELNQLKPGMPEARLLEAEMNMRARNGDEARTQLENLLNDENTPEWIFIIAEDYLNKLP